MGPVFSASLMCMDLLHVEDNLKALENGCSMLHADVMDGHFAKNLTLSIDFIKAVKSVSDLPIDVHMMVTNPDDYLDKLIDIKVDYISLHLETINTSAFRLMRKIKNAGIKFGIALNPATPLSSAEFLLRDVDLLTIMAVDIGYAGQQFITPMLEKINEAKMIKEEKGYSYIIQVDGGCGPKTYKNLWEAGASAFVMGTSGLFGRASNITESCELMNREFSEAVKIKDN